MQLFLTILIISILCGAEVDLFIPSFPEIQRVFNLSPFLVQLTLSANFLSYALCSLFAGSLGDRFNRRTVMLVSLAIFVLGSILCVVATHYGILVLGRFLQGMGMAGPAVLSYVIILEVYPPRQQIYMVGLLNGVVTISMGFAPVIGSYVNLYFNWRANFIILLILGIVSFIASCIFVPSHKGDASVTISLKSYFKLLKSKKVVIYIASLSLSAIAYWIFIGMAPIFYMESLGVKLSSFGYYQGIIVILYYNSGHHFMQQIPLSQIPQGSYS